MSENTTNENVIIVDKNPYFGRYEFITESPALAITSIVLLSIASLVGTFGNVLILIVISKTKEMKHKQSIFMINLALSDLFVTVVADPMSIVGELTLLCNLTCLHDNLYLNFHLTHVRY